MKGIVYLLLMVFISVKTQSPMTLYHLAKNIEELNNNTFAEKVENSTSAWLVEFYSASCGFCQGFAPTWRAFSNEIAHWKDVLKVGVVECTADFNIPLCREHNIPHYPFLKYFHENYKKTPTSMGVVINHDTNDLEDLRDATPSDLKKLATEQIQKEISEGRGAIFPNLLPYTGTDLTSLIKGVNNTVQYVVLIKEISNETVGAEVAMDLHKIKDKVPIRYMLVDGEKRLEDLDPNEREKMPTLLSIDKKGVVEVFSQGNATKPEIIKRIADFLTNKGITVEIPKIENDTTYEVFGDPALKELREYLKNMGDVVFHRDLEAALRNSLKKEVAMHPVIEGKAMEALNAYLVVIKKYFPFGYNSHSFINQLVNLTSTVTQLKGSEIDDIVKEAERNGIFSSSGEVLGCLGSVPYKRGFTCSMWKLFHYLTVNSAELNANNTEIHPTEVLNAMHGYVENFFLCLYCRQHFLKMADARNITSVSSWEQSILWLWQSHNVVNNRLKDAPSADKEYPKVQFPTKENCPSCHIPATWNEPEILKYLKNMYGRYNVRYIGTDTSVLFPAIKKNNY